MDLLSSIVERLAPEGRVFCRSELATPWGLQLPASDFAHFHFVEEGQSWLQLQSPADASIQPPGWSLAAGDLAFIVHGRAHLLTDAPDSKAVPLAEALRGVVAGEGCRKLRLGDGPAADTRTICGAVRFTSPDAALLLGQLPDVIVVKGAGAWLSPTLGLLQAELSHPSPGHALVVTRLIDVLFLHVLRRWLEVETRPLSGWAGALRDPVLVPAVSALHAAPQDAWSVSRLARHAALSRSSFSARFTATVGEPPLVYVTRVRMETAARLLREHPLSVDEVAGQVGYSSEAAFSRAFKRHHGRSPRDYRRHRQER